MDEEKIKSIAGIVLILGLFVSVSYLVQTNLDFFRQHVDIGVAGMILFVLIVALSIILAPVSSVPLFPLGSSLWGCMMTGVLGAAGWTLGAVVAFILARKFGVSLVARVLPTKKIYRFEGRIPDENLFWTIVFLRMVIPVDGVSYLVGLFSKMRLGSYTLATIIGLVPFTFMTACFGSINFYYQVIFVSIASLMFLTGLLIAFFRKKRRQSG
ncbi:MAG: VTT domain-containing protein [Candidatus Woesearchaeota archaeon]